VMSLVVEGCIYSKRVLVQLISLVGLLVTVLVWDEYIVG
jgi:hypothetical protein